MFQLLAAWSLCESVSLSDQRCKKCQRPHHSLLHAEPKSGDGDDKVRPNNNRPTHISHVARTDTSQKHILLMTCRVLVVTPDDLTTQGRTLLDSASSTSFVSERLVQRLRLPHRNQLAHIAGIGGVSHRALSQSVFHFAVTHTAARGKTFDIQAIVLPRVTSELPLRPITFDRQWTHLSGLQLADPNFGIPGYVDILLGMDVFSSVLLHGRRTGTPGSPSAFQTCFGWVLAGAVSDGGPEEHVVSYHASLHTGDDLLRAFWEIEDRNPRQSLLSLDEESAVNHFATSCSHDETGRFMVPLPKKPHTKQLGESRSQAVRRFLSLKRSLHGKGQFQEFAEVIDEYLEMSHAELVPAADLQKPCCDVFYMPMQAVVKSSSTTTRVRAVFDASVKTSTGVSLNDQLLVGPTVHSSLIDVLMRFRLHRVVLTTDVSRMYCAVALCPSDRDLHQFIWRRDPSDILKDYRMTRITFGVSASSFIANMCVKQNAEDHIHKYPEAALTVCRSFYVDDGLVGADSLDEARELRQQLQDLFSAGRFLLRKWKSSGPAVLAGLPSYLLDIHSLQTPDHFVKAFGVEWSATSDLFHLTVSSFPQVDTLTKRVLISSIARIFDVLGWYAPSVIKVKILFQRLWKERVDWDDPVLPEIEETWERWKGELPVLAKRPILRCYFPKHVSIAALQLHGFGDASESAYAGVVYLRMVDTNDQVHVAKVAPIKRLTIPQTRAMWGSSSGRSSVSREGAI